MARHSYVEIASKYERMIRTGELRPGSRLHSYSDIGAEEGVSDIVVRKALELLMSQGLIRSVRRKGLFVSDRPGLVRVSPERQMESAEQTFSKETSEDVTVARDVQEVRSDKELAEKFGLSEGVLLRHTLTKATEGGRPVSISDTWQPMDLEGIGEAITLEETLSDRIPPQVHGDWLGVEGLAKIVKQRFIAADGRLVMYSEVTYPRDRYVDGFLFRMDLEDRDN